MAEILKQFYSKEERSDKFLMNKMREVSLVCVGFQLDEDGILMKKCKGCNEWKNGDAYPEDVMPDSVCIQCETGIAG